MFVAGGLVALAAFALMLSPSHAIAKKNMTNVKGTITAIDTTAGTVTIEDANGDSVTVTVEDSTKIHKNNDEGASIEDLAVGDKAKSRYNEDTLVARRIHAKTPVAHIHGEIIAVDVAGASVTIQPDEGDAVTLLVTEDTRLNRNDEPATLEDFVVGDHATAKYNPVTSEARRINASSQQDEE
jgi:hypothetical protein